VFTDNVDDPDFRARIIEAEAVLDKVDRNPILGSGFDVPIGVDFAYDQRLGDVVAYAVYPAHNGYLSLLLGVGLIGLGFFCLLAARIVAVWWWTRKRVPKDLFVWCLTVGFGLSLIRILLNGFTESTFNDTFTVPLVGLGVALLERGSVMAFQEQPKSV
jgi:O-antigen ligase